MKKILLAVAFLVGSVASAAAACTGPAVMHDFPGTAFNMSLATAPDTNCESNVAVPSWAGGTLGAMANYGTSPGAVLVPGVNSSVTASVLPTGAATAAKQPALGTAGTPSTDVITVQGIASAVPQPVSGTFWQATQPVSGTFFQATQPVSQASGSVASGAYASGAIASGAYAAGSLSNGASVAQGSTTDVPCTLPATATACSEIAAQKAIANAVNGPSVALAGTTPTTSTPVSSGANSQIQTDLHGNLYIAPSQVVTTGGSTTANSVPTNSNSQYPVNSVTTAPTPLVAKGTGTTGAVTGTLTPGATATAYVCGFSVSYVGGTAQVGPLVLSGLLGGSFTYQIPVSATAGQTFGQTFTPCIPASAVNTAIVMTTVADGTATAVDVNIWGYGL